MGHKNKKSLIRQTQERLDSMLAIGESKHQDKKIDLTKRKIYSWSTYKSYLQQCCQFVRYCRDNHHCKNLADCRQYVGEWMESRKDLSAYSSRKNMELKAGIHSLGNRFFHSFITPSTMRNAWDSNSETGRQIVW